MASEGCKSGKICILAILSERQNNWPKGVGHGIVHMEVCKLDGDRRAINQIGWDIRGREEDADQMFGKKPGDQNIGFSGCNVHMFGKIIGRIYAGIGMEVKGVCVPSSFQIGHFLQAA